MNKNSHQSIFKRYEKKYLLNNIQYKNFKKDLNNYMNEDDYNLHTICNLYFDTDNYELIRRSIEKPIYKEKLRVRSYGIPKENDTVFFELKKKYLKEVFKRRISMPHKDFINYIENKIKPNASQQILSEIEYFIKLYNPYPRVFIAYDRLALYGKDNSKVRVTFDSNIRFRTNNLSLSYGDNGTQLLKKGEKIMEIKVEGAMPLWLVNLLNKHNILPTSYSKYGKCYENYLIKNTNNNIRKKVI